MKIKAMSKKAVLAKGALMASVKLAADKKLDLDGVLKGVTHANWVTSKTAIAKAIKPVLAADADIDDVVKLLDSLDDLEDHDEPKAAMDADPLEEIMEFLKDKLSEEDHKSVGEKLRAMHPAAKDEGDQTDKEKDDADKKNNKDNGGEQRPVIGDEEDDKEDKVPDKKPEISKGAMDAAIKLAADKARKEAIAEMNAIHEAEEIVKPYVGKLAMSFDSAESVYKAALETLGIAVDMHPSAYRAVLLAQRKPGEQTRIAIDSAPAKGFSERFPSIAAIRQV